MDGGGVVGDESLKVVVDLEVIGHVAVLLPVCLIELHQAERQFKMGERDGETEKWSSCSGGGGVVKYRVTLVNCGCVACSHGGD